MFTTTGTGVVGTIASELPLPQGELTLYAQYSNEADTDDTDH